MRRSNISAKRNPQRQQQNKKFIKLGLNQNNFQSVKKHSRTPSSVSKGSCKQQNVGSLNSNCIAKKEQSMKRQMRRQSIQVFQLAANSPSGRRVQGKKTNQRKQAIHSERKSLRNIVNQKLSQQTKVKASSSAKVNQRQSFSVLQANLGKLNQQFLSNPNNPKNQRDEQWVNVFLQKLDRIVPPKKTHQTKRYKSLNQSKLNQFGDNFAQTQGRTQAIDSEIINQFIKKQLSKVIKQSLLPFIIDKMSQLQKKFILFSNQVNQKIRKADEIVEKSKIAQRQKAQQQQQMIDIHHIQPQLRQQNHEILGLKCQISEIKEQLQRIQFAEKRNSSSGKIRKNIISSDLGSIKSGNENGNMKKIFQELNEKIQNLQKQSLEITNDFQLATFDLSNRVQKIQHQLVFNLNKNQQSCVKACQAQDRKQQNPEQRIHKLFNNSDFVGNMKQGNMNEGKSQRSANKFEKVIRIYNENFVEIESRLTKIEVDVSKIRNQPVKQDHKIRKTKR